MRLVLLALFALLLCSTVLAQEALRVELVVTSGGQVVVRNIKAVVGDPDEPGGVLEGYSLRVREEAGAFESAVPVQFFIYALPARPVKDILVTRRIPYSQSGVLELVKEDEVVFSYDLEGLCSANGVCDGFENALSCPQDCPLSVEDDLCLARSDGVCDPDCLERVDTDCIGEQVKQSSLGRFSLLAGLLFIAGVGIALYIGFRLRMDT